MRPTRIAILGTSGAGKTTLGRELARRIGGVFVEVDALRHKANWVVASDDELRVSVAAALAGQERWVIDSPLLRLGDDLVAGPADVIVWLDLPLLTKLVRALRRSWRRVTTRERLWNGNVETWRDVFVGRESVVQWLVYAHRRDRREAHRRPYADKTVRLRSPRQVARWLAQL